MLTRYRRTNGWSSLFAGARARIALIIPSTDLYLPTYDSLKRTADTLSSNSSNRRGKCQMQFCSVVFDHFKDETK